VWEGRAAASFFFTWAIDLVVSDKKIFKISANENTLWTLAAMLDFKSAPKSGRGPSSEHFWQVWLIRKFGYEFAVF
jgi:hypothetical protein